jgi:hypothetical protein
MPGLTKTELKNMMKIPCEIFVETGTYLGETTSLAKDNFEKVYTIEVTEYYYNLAKQLFNGTNVTCYLGDSSIVLKEICPMLDKPTCFWLDGHYSAGNTGKGLKNVPLYEELQLIMTHCCKDCVILIDDCRLFGKSGVNLDGWEVINTETILEIVKSRMVSYSFFPSNLDSADRMSIILNMKQ